MECVTVLKHPELCDKGRKSIIGTRSRKGGKGLSRLCRQQRQSIIIAGLLIFTLLSYILLLWFYLNLQALNTKLHEANGKLEILNQKINDLLEVKRIEIQREAWLTNKKDVGGNREARQVSIHVPHFHLQGCGDQSQGIFGWTWPNNRPFDGVSDDFMGTRESRLNPSCLTKIKIKQSGMYYVYAKVTGNGREIRGSNVDPALGIFLMVRRNSGDLERLDSTWSTQDERGFRYHTRPSFTQPDKAYPVDSISVMGLFLLNVNDEIYVQKPPDGLHDPNGERYINTLNFAHFGAFMVEKSSF